MDEIISPVEKSTLEKELNSKRFVRKTNFGQNEIYIVTSEDSPNVMREIGRLREVTFRQAGGGTGKSIDVDEYDFPPAMYNQLVVWDPFEKEIVGGYRYICCKDAVKNEKGEFKLATSHLYHFSEKFINEYMPFTIELVRSFVQPKYQPVHDSKKGLFALDNIWDGLGAVIIDNPDIKYFFGKVTMYLKFNASARDLIIYFMQKYFPDNERLVVPFKQRGIETDSKELEKIFSGNTYQENFKILVQNVRLFNENIPPLVNAYMNLSPSMINFGSTINDTFGDVEEIGILVTIKDIYDAKKERHLLTYKKEDK